MVATSRIEREIVVRHGATLEVVAEAWLRRPLRPAPPVPRPNGECRRATVLSSNPLHSQKPTKWFEIGIDHSWSP
jgi:hypothetical protein